MKLVIDEIESDPNVKVGGYLWLQRQDGRSLWQQRFVVRAKTESEYHLKPVDVAHGY